MPRSSAPRSSAPRAAAVAAGLLAVLALVWVAWPAPAPTPEVPLPAPAQASRPGPSRAAVLPPPELPGFLVPAPEAEPPEDTGEAEAEADTGAEPVGDEDMPLFTVLRAHIYSVDGAPVAGGLLTSPDCGIWSWTDAQGVAEAVVMGMERCMVQGRRPDGLLWGRSEWLEIELVPDEIVDLDLYVPLERTGGLGVMIRAHEEGMIVEQVWPGTPAAEMGLASGDIITEVDGLPTAALTVDEFVEVMTGPEGSEVAFAIAYAGDTGWTEEPLVLTRARIEER